MSDWEMIFSFLVLAVVLNTVGIWMLSR